MEPLGLATWTFPKPFKRGSNRGRAVILEREEGTQYQKAKEASVQLSSVSLG